MARFRNVLYLAVCTGGVYFSGQGLMEVIYQGDREEKKAGIRQHKTAVSESSACFYTF